MKKGSPMLQAGAPPGGGDEPAGAARKPEHSRARQGLTLRPAEATDETPLSFFFDVLLRRDYFLRRGQLRAMLTEGRHRVLIAEIGGVLVGVAVVTKGARLVNLLVHPAYRGLDIGSALLEASGAREVRVKRDMSAGDPRGFYEACGYEPANGAQDPARVALWRKRAADGCA